MGLVRWVKKGGAPSLHLVAGLNAASLDTLSRTELGKSCRVQPEIIGDRCRRPLGRN